MLFNQRLKDKKAVFQPNKSNKEQSQTINGCRGCCDLELPESILMEAKRRVIKRDAEMKKDAKEREEKEEREKLEKKTQERLSDIEESLKEQRERDSQTQERLCGIEKALKDITSLIMKSQEGQE